MHRNDTGEAADYAITLVLAAARDAGLNADMRRVLELPIPARQAALEDMIGHARRAGAPSELLSALAVLRDDRLARGVLEELRRSHS